MFPMTGENSTYNSDLVYPNFLAGQVIFVTPIRGDVHFESFGK
jgi:hypothetical protein